MAEQPQPGPGGLTLLEYLKREYYKYVADLRKAAGGDQRGGTPESLKAYDRAVTFDGFFEFAQAKLEANPPVHVYFTDGTGLNLADGNRVLVNRRGRHSVFRTPDGRLVPVPDVNPMGSRSVAVTRGSDEDGTGLPPAIKV